MKAIVMSRLEKMLGLTSQELDDVFSIISTTLLLETAVDVLGSLDPSLILAVGSEIPEIGLDIVMCVKIWEYFNKENLNAEKKSVFMDIVKNNPLETAASGLLAYAITSVLKLVVGKVAGKLVLYVGSTVISGGINVIQTVVTGLLWAKYTKQQSKVAQSTNNTTIKNREYVAA